MTARLTPTQVENIHEFFGISRSNYLVLPRTILQSMPEDWQRKFVMLLGEIEETLECDQNQEYKVTVIKGEDLSNYERGRRILPRKLGKESRDVRP